MNDQLKEAVKVLIQKSIEAERGIDSMQFSQAVLNLSHALATIDGNVRSSTETI